MVNSTVENGREVAQGLSRRHFLSTLSSAVSATLLMMPSFSLAASTTTGESVPIKPPDGSLATEEAFFAELARTFTINPRDRYFTPAQKGSMPIPIMKRYKEGLDQVAADPFPVYLEPSAETRA